MMGRRAMRTNHQGQRMPSLPRQQAVDMTAPETFTTASKQPLTKGREQTAGVDVKQPLQIATVGVAVGGRNRKADTYGSL